MFARFSTVRASLALLLMFLQSVAALADTNAMAPKNLDLSSLSRSVTAPGTATILLAGHARTFLSGTNVTPAEAAAIAQVLATGRQSIVLAANGRAVGGSLVLPSSSQLSTLSIPSGLQVIRDFNGSPAFDVSGNIINGGKFFAVSTSSLFNNATISFADLVNQRGAVLSSVVPVGGLVGFSNAIRDLSLTLIASGNIINKGTISSAGDLTLTGTGSRFLINNVGGTLSAANNIYLSTPNANDKSVLQVTGGNLLSQQVNVNTNGGLFNLFVNQLPGTLNVDASCAHVFAHNAALNLGSINVSGDPTFVTTGDIKFNAPLAVQEKLVLIAGQNIDFNGQTVQVKDITTKQGFDLTVVAGAKFIITGSNQLMVNPLDPSTDSPLSSGSVKVVGTSATGGNITCGGCTLNTSSSAGNLNGGKISIAAYNAPTAANGNIDLTGSIQSSGAGAGKAGNITIIAPGVITLDDVRALGGATIKVSNAQPSGTITADVKGNVIGSLVPSSQLSSSGITMASTSSKLNVSGVMDGANAGTIALSSKGTINLPGQLLLVGANGAATPTAIAAQSNGGKGGTVLINAGNLNFRTVYAYGGKGTTTASGGGGKGGSGGTITINAVDFVTALSSAELQAAGYDGGDGANGVDGSSPAHPNGTNGGNGGAGGAGGKITINCFEADLGNGAAYVVGGGGGNAGIGGNGFAAAAGQGRGGNGGNGGNAGNAGAGGTVVIHAGDQMFGSPVVQADGGSTSINNTGGKGGVGGSSADAQGGNGGRSGNGGAGGNGGLIVLTAKTGLFLANTISNAGGFGTDAGTNNTVTIPSVGGAGKTTGGNGGSSGRGGAGGRGGTIFVQGDSIQFANSGGTLLVSAYGGDGGSGKDGSNGGDGTTGNGGRGGSGGSGGAGGRGGIITMLANSALTSYSGSPTDLNLSARGGGAGVSGNGGNGGNGGTSGGNGGSGAAAPNGANAGTITLTATNGSVNTGVNHTGLIDLRGGTRQTAGSGGFGGNGNSGNGGLGGSGGQGSAGGSGGTLKITGLDIVSDASVRADGNAATAGGGGGLGGASTAAAGGAGGTGGTGRAGGRGGNLTLIATGSDPSGTSALHILGTLEAPGGTGASGGRGGENSFVTTSGTSGGRGGNAGFAGIGGRGGSISLSAGNGSVDIDDSATTSYLTVDGGNGGLGGKGGDGGSGAQAGANAGRATSGAPGGAAGRISISAVNIRTGNGGDDLEAVSGPGGLGGDGGIGGNANFGRGGAGSNGGNGGAAGNAGAIILSAKQNVSLSLTLFATGTMGGYGGVGGAGGTGFTVGGNGGNAGNGGRGGGNGTIAIAAGGQVSLNYCNVSAGTGADAVNNGGGGGYALQGINQVLVGNGGNGGNAGSAGAGGNGGIITIKAGTTVSNAGGGQFTLDADGGYAGAIFGSGGWGGWGGSVAGFGGRGGNAAIGAAGGAGGKVTITAVGDLQTAGSGKITADGGGGSANTTLNYATGGVAGNAGTAGGAGGSSSTGGDGGRGGKIALQGANIVTLPSIDALGGPGGGAVFIAGNGGSGGIGGNGGNVNRSGNGASGGSVSLKSTATNLAIQIDNNIRASGGNGAHMFAASTAGTAGNSTSGRGANGGSVARTGSGGAGGLISISAPAGTFASVGPCSLIASGGIGGQADNVIAQNGSAGAGTNTGGNGGNLGGTGFGAAGGVITISAHGLASLPGLYAQGAPGGYLQAGTAGNGGAGGIGGNGGSIGSLGRGGNGGIIFVQNSFAATSPAFDAIFANGNDGGISYARSGIGAGQKPAGAVAPAANGGHGGNVTILSAGGVDFGNTVYVAGGEGGVGSNKGVSAAAAATGVMGAKGGAGGTGGRVLVVASSGPIGLDGGNLFTVNGGIGGDGNVGVSSASATSNPQGGTGGSGGKGGNILFIASGNYVNNGFLSASGGGGGTGGQGGPDLNNVVGGKGGTGGNGGNGGAISISSGQTVAISTGEVIANGGIGGTGGQGAHGADTAFTGVGGTGGKGGTGGNGGNGGVVSLKGHTIDEAAVGMVLALGGGGGHGGTGGAGGSNFQPISPSIGGFGGDAGDGGDGGNGGTIILIAPSLASITPPAPSSWLIGVKAGSFGSAGSPGVGGSGFDGTSGPGGPGMNGSNGAKDGQVIVEVSYVTTSAGDDFIVDTALDSE